MDGSELFDLVQQYSNLGVHRAGTPIDAATAEWMHRQLEARGVRVEREAVPFPMWEATSTLWLNGVEVDHLPVHYCWTGRIDTTTVDVVRADVGFGGKRVVLEPAFAAAMQRGGEAAVFATGDASASLRAVNQKPTSSFGLPAVLIAGRQMPETVQHARLSMNAQIVEGTTTNLIGRNAAAMADPDEPPVLISTPLTGWFTCAGERGTGIAVLLDLVERFADVPLLILATGGHEFDYFGARAWVPGSPPCRAVVHIGASVAAESATRTGRELAKTRFAKTSLMADHAAAVADNLNGLNLRLEADPERWAGESEVFSALGVPMLSFSGAATDFHTPEDLPAKATTPKTMAKVANGFAQAIRLFLGAAS